jgi:hypothetical protein
MTTTGETVVGPVAEMSGTSVVGSVVGLVDVGSVEVESVVPDEVVSVEEDELPFPEVSVGDESSARQIALTKSAIAQTDIHRVARAHAGRENIHRQWLILKIMTKCSRD